MAPLSSVAQTLPKPSGPVLLVVTGDIAVTNDADAARFDLALLDSLPQHSFVTATIWTNRSATYSGVLLKDLLQVVGAQGKQLEATALNDYRITLPLEEATDKAPLLATRADGVPLTVRTKGPIWLLYPFDTDDRYRTEETFARAIWQLDRIRIVD